MRRLWVIVVFLVMSATAKLWGDQCEVVCPPGYKEACGVKVCGCKCGCVTSQQIEEFIKDLEKEGYRVPPEDGGAATLVEGLGPIGIPPLGEPTVDTSKSDDDKVAPASRASEDEAPTIDTTSLQPDPPPGR